MTLYVSFLFFYFAFPAIQAIGDCPDLECENCARLLLEEVYHKDFMEGFKMGDFAKPMDSLCFKEAIWFNGTDEFNVKKLLGGNIEKTIGRFRCSDPTKMCLLSQAGRTGNEQYLLNTGEEFIHLVPFCMGTMCTVKSIIQLPEGYDNSNDVAGLIKYGTNDDIRRYSWQFRNGDYYDIYDSAFLPIDVISCNGCPINPENYCMEPKE